MRKLALYITVAVMVIAMFLPFAVEVGAANPPSPTDSKVSPVRPNLSILAVDSALVGQPVRITVSSNANKVVEKAAVYVISTDNLTFPVDIKGMAPNTGNYADIAAKVGLLIGYTDSQGNIQHAFNDDGWYILVAIKDGFNPASRKIAIGQITQMKQLVLKIAESATTGLPVQIGVYSRSDQVGVGGASVYALKFSMVLPAVAPFVSNRKPEPNTSASVSSRNDERDNPKMVAQPQPGIEEIKSKGILLGATGPDGLLQYTFTDPGLYIIAAVKDGYNPGIVRLNVKPEDKANLQIKAPGSAAVSENITIGVFERKTGKPVEKAAVYVLKYKPVALPAPVPTENGTATQKVLVRPSIAPDAGMVIKTGVLAGYTDASGKMVYSFGEAGMFLIAATRDGYDPDLARIEVGASPAQDYLKLIAPATARVNQEITVKVLSRSGKGEPGVKVYSIKNGDLPVVDNTTAAVSIAKPQLYAEYAVSLGTLVGTTDENGKFSCKFTEAGRFILVAVKDGFVPGFGRINVAVAMRNALAFKMPSKAMINQDVTIKVVDRNDGAAVAEADVYGYRINGFADAVGHFFQETFSFGNSGREKYAGGVSEIGEYIGSTDETGTLVYAFPEKGTYIMVTFKSGYVPDFGKIEIDAPSTSNKK
jgi:uncharacterized GH25 family protein